jgi:hypothetical protein
MLAKKIQAVSVLALIGLLGFCQLPSKAQDKKPQPSPQSIGRD